MHLHLDIGLDNVVKRTLLILVKYIESVMLHLIQVQYRSILWTTMNNVGGKTLFNPVMSLFNAASISFRRGSKKRMH